MAGPKGAHKDALALNHEVDSADAEGKAPEPKQMDVRKPRNANDGSPKRMPQAHDAGLVAEGEVEQRPNAEAGKARGARKNVDRYATDPQAAPSALDVAAQILHSGDTAAIRPPLQTPDIVALWELHAAATQTQDGKPIKAAAALALLDHAAPTLMQARTSYLDDGNTDNAVWVEDRVLAPLRALRDRLTFSVASERVDQAVLVDGHVYDVGDGAPVKEQEAGLRAAIGKVVPVLGKLNDLSGLAYEAEMEHEFERQLEGHLPKTHYASMLDLANTLNVIDGLLTLSDDELHEHLAKVHGIFEGVQTAAELVKAATEFVGGCTGLTLGMVGAFAKLAGDKETAQVAIGAGRFLGARVATVVVYAEIVSEVFGIITSKTGEEKVSHALNAGAGIGLLAAKKGAVTFGASAIALQLSYGEARLAATLYWEGAQGIVQALMTPAFEELLHAGNGIASGVERVIKARALVDEEQDSERRDAYKRVLAQRALECGKSIDDLIDDIAAPKLSAAMASHPGAYNILADALAPVRAYRGSQTPEAVMTGAAVALSRLNWVFANAKEILFEATTHGHVGDVERLAAERARKPKETAE